jgi:CheY-like chemotaxis protein
MLRRPTVLVAEDDPVFRRVIAFSIERAGFGCETASNGVEAIRLIDRGGIDFLVTDHQMPHCSGLELIEQIRNRAEQRPLPIVLCTAKGYELDSTELVRSYGLLAIIGKPFSPKQLIRVIASQFLDIPALTTSTPRAS